MRNKLLAALLLLLAPLPALAHVTLSEPQAAPGSDYVAHFRVGHGCGGSPTTALTIGFPISVSDVRPEVKPGWKVSQNTKGPGVKITWRGGRIPADKPDEFTVAMRLPMGPGLIAFPATQTCEKGREVWSELPTADGHHLDHPVPLLNVGATPADAMPGMGAMPPANKPSSLSLSDGWIRLLPGALPAAGYFTLHNAGKAKVALTGADTPACGMLMLHKSDDKGGMSSMQDVKSVDVPGGGEVQFTPGGYHLMCMDPKPVLKLGASVPVTLSFQGAPPLTARFDVRGATGK